jgi:hypothetical protein
LPTYETLPRFDRDYDRLSPAQRTSFRVAIEKFVADLDRGRGFRSGLRVKGVQGSPGIYELTWADDGRATFQFGPSKDAGEPHVIWRRVGTHNVFGNP